MSLDELKTPNPLKFSSLLTAALMKAAILARKDGGAEAVIDGMFESLVRWPKQGIGFITVLLKSGMSCTIPGSHLAQYFRRCDS